MRQNVFTKWFLSYFKQNNGTSSCEKYESLIFFISSLKLFLKAEAQSKLIFVLKRHL